MSTSSITSKLRWLTPAATSMVRFFFSCRRRHTSCYRDWSSDVCSSDLEDLREGSEDDHAPAGLEALLDAVRILGIADVLEVRLVEDCQDVSRDLVQEARQLGARVRRAGRVVRNADVDELRPLGDRVEQRVEVVAVLAERRS